MIFQHNLCQNPAQESDIIQAEVGKVVTLCQTYLLAKKKIIYFVSVELKDAHYSISTHKIFKISIQNYLKL